MLNLGVCQTDDLGGVDCEIDSSKTYSRCAFEKDLAIICEETSELLMAWLLLVFERGNLISHLWVITVQLTEKLSNMPTIKLYVHEKSLMIIQC